MKANTISNILINFGNSIKVFRRDNGISQFEFAVDLEIDPKVLRNIENGKTDARYDTVVKIINKICSCQYKSNQFGRKINNQ